MFSGISGLGGTNNTASSSKNQISGLISGIDTEALIEKLVSGTQSRIDAQDQKRQKIEWKQQAYQDIIKEVNSLMSKYLDILNPDTCLGSNSAFNSWSAESSSSAVTALATALASGNKLVISEVSQLATNEKYISGSAVSEGIKSSSDITDLIGKSFSITLDGVTKEIDFGADPQAALDKAFGANRVKLNALDGGGFEITATGSSSLTVSGDKAVLESVGLKNGQANFLTSTTKLGDIGFANKLIGEEFSFSINGKEFSFTADDTLMNVLNTVNGSDAGVKIRYSQLDDKFSIESTVSGTGSNINIEETKGNLMSAMFTSNFGTDGISGKILYSERAVAEGEFVLPEAGWGPILNKSFEFTVDGKTKTISLTEEDFEGVDFNADTAKQTIVDKLNAKISKEFGTSYVKFDIDDATGKVLISSPADKAVSVKEESAGVLSVLGFGSEVSNAIDGSAKLSALGLESGELTIGSETISYNGDMTIDELISAVNAKSADTGMKLEFADGKFTLGADIENTKLSAFGVQGGEITVGEGADAVKLAYTADMTISEALASINDKTAETGISAEFVNGEIVLSTTNEDVVFADSGNLTTTNYKDNAPALSFADSGSFAEKALGTSSFNGSATGSGIQHIEGQNAKLTLADGTVLERSTNNFTVDGVNLQLNDVSDEPITITSTKDTDAVVDNIKGFFEAYNSLVEKVNSYTKSESYADYPPLTDAQRKEMSEKEIELWEEKAKSGILKGDTYLNEMLDELDSILLNSKDGNLSLYDLGIEASGSLDSQMQYVVNEDKLRAAINENTTAVQNLFAKTEGIADKLTASFNRYVSASPVNTGHLVRISGINSLADSELNNELKDINDRISVLKTSLANEQQSLWSQFSAMEQVLANLNSQSSWLMSFTGQ